MTTPEPVSISAYAQNTAHVEQGLGQLAAQFQGKAKIEGLLKSWLVEVQAVENALWQVFLSGNVTAAVAGAYSDALDKLGELVGITRKGLIDAQYEFALAGAVEANNSTASPGSLTELVHVTEGPYAVVTEGYPAAVRVDPGTSPVHVPALTLLGLLKRAKPAGVKLNLLEYTTGAWFSFSSGETVEVDPPRGWSDTVGLVGGEMIGVLE